MKKEKSTKTFAEYGRKFLKQIRDNADNDYYLSVLYYYVRRALAQCDFNLRDVDGFSLNGRFLGYKEEILISKMFDTPLRSISLAMSIRAIMLNRNYLNDCFDNRLLFFNLDTDFISWTSHRAIMECLDDEEFCLLYKMAVNYKINFSITEEDKNLFISQTVRPDYRNQEKYFKSIANDPSYAGHSVIKSCEHIYADFEEYEVPASVEYVGDTAFAYCQNLKKLKFTRKVLFGLFPIVECNKLRQILVPTELVEYFKQKLPYYDSKISDQEIELEEEVEVEEVTPTPVDTEVPEDKTDDDKYSIDGLEIEHVYVDVNNANSYIETELEGEQDEEEEEEELYDDEPINTNTIYKVFEKKATSYKYFWFLSIISLAKERELLSISYKDIVIRMAAMAWPIVFEDEIDLGKNDKLSKYLADTAKAAMLIPGATSSVVEKHLIQHYESKKVDTILSPLLKNVPYRFLSPWVPYTTDEDVIKKSNMRYFPGLYSLSDDYIILNEDWWDYILENYNKICTFAIQSFCDYLKPLNGGMKLLKLKKNEFSFINL